MESLGIFGCPVTFSASVQYLMYWGLSLLLHRHSQAESLRDSKGRENLESKSDMRARGLESPDRADAVIGAAVMSLPGFTGASPWIRSLACSSGGHRAVGRFLTSSR